MIHGFLTMPAATVFPISPIPAAQAALTQIANAFSALEH
jgi:hypothetical protein